MTLQTLKIGKREFILLSKHDFHKLAAQAQRQTEDDYWTKSALAAEAEARINGQKPISLRDLDRELDARKSTTGTNRRGKRR